MNDAEWAGSHDPEAMLRWLSRQGRMSALWEFATGGCRRVYHRLPGPRFRKVVDLAEDMGRGLANWEMVDEALHQAGRALERLEARHQDAEDPEEQALLEQKIGAAQIVWAFEFQDGYEAALAVCRHLIGWAEDAEAERIRQADALRRLVPDPGQSLEAED